MYSATPQHCISKTTVFDQCTVPLLSLTDDSHSVISSCSSAVKNIKILDTTTYD